MDVTKHPTEIIEVPIKDFSGTVPHRKLQKYPFAPPQAHCPSQYFVAALIGSRSAGKSFSACRLIYQFQRYGLIDPATGGKCAQRCILISPSVEANPVFTGLRWLSPDDIHTTYSEELLEEVVDSIKFEAEATKEYLGKLALFKQLRKVKNVEDLTPEQIDLLEECDGDISTLPKPRYEVKCCVFLILDDLIGQGGAYSNKAKNLLTNITLRNRHIGLNILFLLQSMKALQKNIRNNVNLWCLYQFANKQNILKDLYPEVSMLVTEKEFEALYNAAVARDHSFLYVDLSSGLPADKRFRAGFDKYLCLKKNVQK